MNHTQEKPTPVLVVTDIGADIDDTLALFGLLGSLDVVNIVAIVTCVNNGVERGILTRGFLRLLGITDDKIEILPSSDNATANCYIPKGFPIEQDVLLGKVEDTPQRIIDICREHRETGLYILGLAPLTPIANAIKLDMTQDNIMQTAVTKIYLQGNCDVSSNGILTPIPLAYNFKVDINAAKLVFKHFEQICPFVILGKFAAYKVPITIGDFHNWATKLKTVRDTTFSIVGKEYQIPQDIDLFNISKQQMKRFRNQHPRKFDSIYNVPKNLPDREINKFDWYDKLPNEFVCSHPYDPLLVLRMVQDIRSLQNKTVARLFHDTVIKNQFGVENTLIGNVPIKHSVPDVERVHNALSDMISSGIISKANS